MQEQRHAYGDVCVASGRQREAETVLYNNNHDYRDPWIRHEARWKRPTRSPSLIGALRVLIGQRHHLMDPRSGPEWPSVGIAGHGAP